MAEQGKTNPSNIKVPAPAKPETIQDIIAEIASLQKKFADGTDTEADYKRLTELRAKKKAKDESAKAEITSLRKQVLDSGHPLETIFDASDFKKAGYAKIPSTGTTESKTSTAKDARASKSNFVLIHIQGKGKGDPGYKLNKGRIYEQASELVKKPFSAVPSQLKTVAVSIESLTAKLADNTEAKAYIATEAGKKELEAIVAFATNANLKVSELPKA